MATTKFNPTMVALDAIDNKFDVRTALDEDRVVQLAGIYEAGGTLPPVKLVRLGDDRFAYIDGRHRGAARAYLNKPDVEALIFNGSLKDNPTELFAQALESNWGGAKPPSRIDIIHTILRMLEHGATQASIRERLRFLPAGSLAAYIASARSTLIKRKLSKAVEEVAGGRTVEDAARRQKVNLQLLQNTITGKTGRKLGGTFEQELAISVKSHISGQLSTANRSIGKKLQDLLLRVEDGEVSPNTALGIVESWAEHLRKTQIRVRDWTERLTAISEGQEKARDVSVE